MRASSLFSLAGLGALVVHCSQPTQGADATMDASDASLEASAPDAPADAPPPYDLTYVDPYRCDPASSPPPLDARLDATQARAGVLTRATELVTGEGAYSQLGHLMLYNDRVRFVVQSAVSTRGPLRPVGYGLYGGNLIDADRVRGPGEPGQDLFREMFTTVSLREGGADEVTVVCDGSGGRPAVVRVVGRDLPTRLMAAVDRLAVRQNVRIITHYILRPGSSVLELRTRVDSLTGAAFDSASAGDFLAFGSSLTLFSPLTGMGDPMSAGMPVPYLVGASDPGEGDRHVSYGLALPSGGITLPLVDESGTFGQYTDLAAPAGGSAEFVRYFSVGTGDVASAARPLFEVRQDPFGTVTGTAPSGALVVATNHPYAVGSTVRMSARAAADGTYSMPLPPGDYDVFAVQTGHLRGTPVRVAVSASATAMVNPAAGATGTLVLDLAERVTDGSRPRVPLRVSLRSTAVEAPDPGLGDVEGEREMEGAWRVLFSLTGTERVPVKPGAYHAIVSRGLEYDVVERDLVVPPSGEVTLTADVPRVVDTAGYVSGDFHQHTVGSVDSGRTLCNRVLEGAAVGLEFASTTDHDNATDFGPCVRSLGLTRFFNSTIGNEISVVGVGHFNAYPLAPEATDPYRLVGAQYWADLTPQQLFDRVRAERSDPILHVSHPRSGNGKGYFAFAGLDPTTGNAAMTLGTGFEALEVNESVGAPEDFLPSARSALQMRARTSPTSVDVMHDFFALLSRGGRVCALGNSDTHKRNDTTGWPRNLLRVGDDAPDRATPELVRAAIRAQQVLVANGIVVRMRVNGAERMGLGERVSPTSGAVSIELDVQAPPWVPAQSIALFENGVPLTLVSTGTGTYDGAPATTATGLTLPLAAMGTQRLRATVRVRPTRDSYYVAVARGGSLAPYGRGSAYGYTNALYVDVDGGDWSPPGL